MRRSCASCPVRIVAAIGLCAAVFLAPGCKRNSPIVATPGSQPSNGIAAVPITTIKRVDNSTSIDSEAVDNALSKARRLLYVSSPDGQWGAPDAEDPHIGDKTALVLRALLKTGESHLQPEIIKSLAPLMQAQLYSTQSVADRLRLQVLLPVEGKNKQLIKRDAALLMSSIKFEAGKPALHAGSTKETRVSLPASAAATTALADASPQIEVPIGYWKATEQAWHDILQRELFKGPTISPEGLCAVDLIPILRAMDVLVTADEQLQLNRGDGKTAPSDAVLAAALKQIEANYPAIFHGPGEYEAMNTFARIMRSRGQRFVGNRDWYQDAATMLLAIQRGDGSWGDGANDTAYAMLFLTRNRAPVLFNKLQYESAGGKLPSWNNHPKELSHLTGWISDQLERPFDWQVLNIDAPFEDWNTAPILYISGDTTPEFKPEQLAKIKQFIEQGGMVVGNADSNSVRFASSFMTIGSFLFPNYGFRDLPADHLLFNNLFNKRNWVVVPRVRALTNGVRELMILFPTDQAIAWQSGQFTGAKQLPSAQLAANIVLYATDRKFRFKEDRFRYRMNPASISAIARSYTPSIEAEALKRNIIRSRDFPQPPPVPEAPLKVATLALIGVEADAAPVPDFASLRAAMLLKHGKVNVDPLVLGKWTLQRYDIASIAAGRFSALAPLQRLEIKRFIETGGTLFVDASANPEKVPAVEGQLARLFSEPKLTFGPQTPADTLIPNVEGPVRIGHYNNRAAVIVNAHSDQADAILQSLLEAHLK